MKYVIIGSGAAGISAAKTITEFDSNAEVTVIAADKTVYSRCMLHHVISGQRTETQISFVDADFFDRYGIDWCKGRDVKAVDFDNHEVLLDDDSRVSYDELLIATGAKASVPSIPGFAGAANVFTLRNIEDVAKINLAAESAKKAVVLGGGLVGLDAAAALVEKGLDVAVVEMADHVLPLQLDEFAAKQYQTVFEKRGAKIYTGVSVAEGNKANDGNLCSLLLGDGRKLECDLVIAAAGVKPNLDFLDPAKIHIDDGIQVDDEMATSVPDVYAAGDVTGLSAIWPNAVNQGIIAAAQMTGHDKRYEDTFTAKNTINLLGLETIAIGLPEAPDDCYDVAIYSDGEIYKKVISKNGIVYGAIFQKDFAYSGFWTKVIKDKIKLGCQPNDIYDASYGDFFQIDAQGNYSYR